MKKKMFKVNVKEGVSHKSIFRLQDASLMIEDRIFQSKDRAILASTYLVHEFSEKEKVDYYETSEESYQVKCWPSYLYIPVVAIRVVSSYLLKRTATSATLRTVVSQPASKVAHLTR